MAENSLMRSVFALLLLLLPAASAPLCGKIDPPSWWVRGTFNPIRILIRGERLQGASVRVPSPLRVSAVRVNAAGTYLFADLDLSRSRQPGPARIDVVTPAGVASIGFTVLPALNRPGRFQGFSTDDVIYLLMPDRFANGDESNDDPAISRGLHDRSRSRFYHGGDFQGIIDRLPYLANLGVTAVWLNPWYDNNDRPGKLGGRGTPLTDYHGYGAIDFYAVDEHLGDLAKLRELVARAHAAGMKVVQDQVANHTGPTHPWVNGPPLDDWFNGKAGDHPDEDWQTWTIMDPHAAPAARRLTLDGWFMNLLPDLNQSNREVRRYLIQNALWWVGVTGLDGIRQDTLPYASREFWAEWRGALAREFPSLSVVGEVLDANPALVAFFQGGAARFDGVDSRIESLFDFPLYFSVRNSFARGRSIREVGRVLAHDWLYHNPSRLVTLLGLHDVTRFMTEPGATVEGLKLAFSFLFTARGTPMIYYGDEIGMQGGNDPDNRRDFPGGWRTDARNAFEPSGRTTAEQEIWSHVQSLARIRRESEALRRGSTKLLHQSDQVLVYARRTPRDFVLAAFNNGAKPVNIEVDVTAAALPDGTPLTALPGGETVTVQNGLARLNLNARSAAIYRK